MPKFQRCNELISYHVAYHMGYKISQMEITTSLVNYNLLHIKLFCSNVLPYV